MAKPVCKAEAERMHDLWESKDPAYVHCRSVTKWIKRVMRRARRRHSKRIIGEA